MAGVAGSGKGGHVAGSGKDGRIALMHESPRMSLLGDWVNRDTESPSNLLEGPGSVEIEAHSMASEMVWGIRSLCWVRWALKGG